jgi:hypothetical protein
MDPSAFDTLARSIVAAGTRRRLLALLAGVPLAGAFSTRSDETTAAPRRKRRSIRNRRQSGDDKDNRKGKRKGQDQAESKTDPSCGDTPCFSGVCCGKDNTCCFPPANQCNLAGLCCAPNCAGRQCGPDGCGNDGTCGRCPAGQVCTESGQCVCPLTLTPCPSGCCDSQGVCQPGNTNGVCGRGGGSCQNCSGTQCCNGSCCADARQVCGELLDVGSGCCYPPGTRGVCNSGNLAQVCCADCDSSGCGVGCDGSDGACLP